MDYTFNKEDIELVKKFIDIRNRGYYASGQQVTEVYNRVLHKNSPSTNCGSCIRGRISELEKALREFEKLSEKAAEATKTEEVEADKASSTVGVDNVSTKEEKTPQEKPKRARKGGK